MTSATVTRTRTLHPKLVAGSIGGLCVAIGLVVGIGIGEGLADSARSDVVSASRTSGLVSSAGDRGLIYTGIPYTGIADRTLPAENRGLIYTGIPYTPDGTLR
jgi:hypothetical protein